MDLISRARAGDGEAFRELTEPHRRELQVHCYRMLGSLQDAEDALQDTLLAAWQGLGGFAGRASIRTWLYRIATNRCLNARRSASRRAAREWDMPAVEPPEPTRLGEVVWLEPYPDSLLDIDVVPGPEARYEQTEAISLAFVTALQTLPPRQVAVLVLRDVLGFPASEVAGMLDSTVDSVNSALKRARAGLGRRQVGDAAPSSAERVLVAEFVRAYESGDVDALVSLFTDDVFVSMPPIPLQYHGRDAAHRLFATIFGSGRRVSLVPTRANGQPAFGVYLRAAGGVRQGSGFYALTLSGDRIRAFTRFESTVFPWFGLPRSLPPELGRLSNLTGGMTMARGSNLHSNRVKPENTDLLTLRVVRREQITPHFVRVTLGGEDVDRFRYMGFDQWFRLFIPVSEQSLSRAPRKLDTLSYLRYLAVSKTDRPILRNYSVRAYREDGPELDVDFVIHGSGAAEGPAASWAQRCVPGDPVAVLDEGIGFNPPPELDRVLLVADESGLPATAGVLASLPAGATGQALIEIPSDDDRQELTAPAGVEVTWIVRPNHDDVPGRTVLDAATTLPANGEPFYGWVVGEQNLPTTLRRTWVRAGVPKQNIMFCGYWRST